AFALGNLVLAGGLALGLHLAGLASGLGSGRLLGFDRPDRIAVAFACSQKTLPVALFLFEAYFKQSYPLAVLPMICYHVGQLLLDTFIAERLAAADMPVSRK